MRRATASGWVGKRVLRRALVRLATLRAATRRVVLTGLISIDMGVFYLLIAGLRSTSETVGTRKELARKQALIVKFGAIGDVIMAIPGVHALYQQGFDIHWVCGRAVQPLLECYSWINLIPAEDKAILLGGPSRGQEYCRSLEQDWLQEV